MEYEAMLEASVPCIEVNDPPIYSVPFDVSVALDQHIVTILPPSFVLPSG